MVWIVAARVARHPRAVGRAVTGRARSGGPAAHGRKQWRLVLLEPAAEAGATFPIDDEVTLGRGGGCTVPLAFDTFVSQVHAPAFDRDGALWVEDLGSRNGTFVDGQPVLEPMQVGKGAHLQVGETVLEVDR